MITARKKAANGQTEQAGKEFAFAETNFPILRGIARLIQRVYFEGFHDGAHEATIGNYIGSLDFQQPLDKDATENSKL